MYKKSHFMLFAAIFWMIVTVLSRDILQRAVDMSLAASCLTIYVQNHFSANSTQKLWLNRINVVALAAAAIFLVLNIYYMFIK